MISNRVLAAQHELKERARPLSSSEDLDPLLDFIGDSRIVLLGEASHGTHEYYTWRTGISQRLISEKEFSFIAVEGDWPECYQINRYVKDNASAASAEDVLGAFRRWPTWLWANREVWQLVSWLKDFNGRQTQGSKRGFYGLDVYSLRDSLHEIIRYLEKADPESVPLAYKAFSCFEPYGHDPHNYAYRTAIVPENCEQAVVDLLVALRKKV